MTITLIDGSTLKVTSRQQIEQLWRQNKISLSEAASVLTNLLNLHPSNAPQIWAYLEKLK